MDPVGFSGFSGVLVKCSLLHMVLVGSCRIFRIFRIFRSSPEDRIFYRGGGRGGEDFQDFQDFQES